MRSATFCRPTASLPSRSSDLFSLQDSGHIMDAHVGFCGHSGTSPLGAQNGITDVPDSEPACRLAAPISAIATLS